MHRHHIVFKSQGGLDFPLNLKELTYEQHEGGGEPHQNRAIDLIYKKELQDTLGEMFAEDEVYSIGEIAKGLHKSGRYFEKHFKRVQMTDGGYRGGDILRQLMGGKLY